MPVAMIILNVILIAFVLAALVGLCTWAVATQHRDHGVVARGPLMRRRVWSRTSRRHAGPVRPWIETSRGEIWPAA